MIRAMISKTQKELEYPRKYSRNILTNHVLSKSASFPEMAVPFARKNSEYLAKARNSFPRRPPPPYSRYGNTKGDQQQFQLSPEQFDGKKSIAKIEDVQENVTLLDNTTPLNFQNSAIKGEPVRKASPDVLPSIRTPSCRSKFVNISIKKHDCTLRNFELIKIGKTLRSNSEVDMIEFCDCKIGNDYCTPVESRKKIAKCKISMLVISYTDHFKKFSRFLYSTFCGCEIKSLCLVYVNLDDQDVNNLRSFMVKGIENLDISYNKRIGPDGFELIGNLIAEQRIKTLKAINCNLEKIKLAKLFAGLKNVNLRELDIGYNNNLAFGGFKTLAKLVASRGIEVLKLRGCQLTENNIQEFYNKLEETGENILLSELDVSYNTEINPACCKVLGLIIKKLGITTLNLAGCRISEEHLTSLMSVKDIKLQKLHLGDESCTLGMEYIEEVCQLLQTVNEILYLRFHRLDNSCRRLLNEQSEKLSVPIQFSDEPEATSD